MIRNRMSGYALHRGLGLGHRSSVMRVRLPTNQRRGLRAWSRGAELKLDCFGEFILAWQFGGQGVCKRHEADDVDVDYADASGDD